VKGQLGLDSVAMVGESAKWVQDLLPVLKKGVEEGGVKVKMSEVFDTATTDFSPILSKVKASGAQYLVVILSHASSDVFAKQWYDARFPIAYGGIDVKSQDANFFERVGGKSLSEVNYLSAMRAPLSPRTIPFVDTFQKRFNRLPVYTGFGTYDGIYAYAEAVRRAGSLDTDKVIKELEKTDMPATVGRIQFDETHDVKSGPGLVNALFVQWQDKGERAILWPLDIATGKFVYAPWMKPRG
jgi:branched-chain amino acid transport system substrate-binding protein